MSQFKVGDKVIFRLNRCKINEDDECSTLVFEDGKEYEIEYFHNTNSNLVGIVGKNFWHHSYIFDPIETVEFKVGDKVRFYSELADLSVDGYSNKYLNDNTDYIVDAVLKNGDKLGIHNIIGWHNMYLFKKQEIMTEYNPIFKVGDRVVFDTNFEKRGNQRSFAKEDGLYNHPTSVYVINEVKDDLNGNGQHIGWGGSSRYYQSYMFIKLKEEIMSKELKVSEEFVLEAYKVACTDWKKKLENQFPDVFANKNLIKEDLESFTVNKSVDTNVFGITISDAWAKDNENFRLKSIGFNNYTTLAIVNFSGIDLIIPVKEKIPSNIIDGKKIVAYINKGRFEVAV